LGGPCRGEPAMRDRLEQLEQALAKAGRIDARDLADKARGQRRVSA
jgi:hypothetical protein